MKKILFFHHGTISVGAGLCALHILESINKDEYEVVVSIPSTNGDLYNKISDMGIRVRKDFPMSNSYMHISGWCVPALSPLHIKNGLHIMKMRSIADRIIMEETPDIVMVNSMTLFWIGKIAKIHVARTICFHRETYCKGWFGFRTKLIKNELNKYFDRIAFISNYDMKQTGNCVEKYIRITDKVDTNLYSALEKEACRKELGLPDGKLILYSGGTSWLKGIKIILKAMTELQINAKLVMLQYKPYEKSYKLKQKVIQLAEIIMGLNPSYWSDQFIKKHNLQDKLILCGRTDEVEKYFVACDMVVFPSTRPHQARPIYEAGIAKRPIIVSDYKNTEEFLNSDSGWTVKGTDHHQWARTIEKVLEGGSTVNSRVEENYKKAIRTNNLLTLRDEISNLLTNI